MIKINPLYFVALGITTTSIAQIVLKVGSSFKILSKQWILILFLSVVSYFIAFVCYYLALRYYDLSKLSPLMTVSTVLIITLYSYFAGENLNSIRILGILLAITSIFFISKS
jgi:drug/metabolite transporter (DMT)-like permease